jgi:hypothetical protein
MSSDISVPLSEKPNGTTPHAQVTNTCLPLGQHPNKTPIFITGTCDTRIFLAWLWASCSDGLSAQLRGEKLIVVPSTANEFRPAVSELRSLDGKGNMNFNTFSLAEDRCVQLLMKKLGMGLHESFDFEDLEFLNICFQGVMRSDTAVAIMTPSRNALPHRTHYIGGATTWAVESAISHRTLQFTKFCVKGTEFLPFCNFWMNPMQPVTLRFTTTRLCKQCSCCTLATVQKEQSNN